MPTTHLVQSQKKIIKDMGNVELLELCETIPKVQCKERLLYWNCKYNTSNDVFSRCKSVHKMATEKSDDQIIQPDNKLELGTSYKLKLGPRWKLGPKVEN